MIILFVEVDVQTCLFLKLGVFFSVFVYVCVYIMNMGSGPEL